MKESISPPEEPALEDEDAEPAGEEEQDEEGINEDEESEEDPGPRRSRASSSLHSSIFDMFSGKRKGSPEGESIRESKRGREESEGPDDDDEGELINIFH
jgi:hypothetical protein